jgi:hypothetical protein
MSPPPRGFEGDDERTLVDDPGAAEPAPIEVVFSRDAVVLGKHQLANHRYRALEIFTRNRIYVIDSALECMEVRDRRTGMSEPEHSLLGAKLVGGQRRYARTLHVARPFPVPGTEAIFVKADRKQPAGLTSKVERVILYVHVASVAMEDGPGAWDDVTSHLLKHGLGR